MQTLRGRRHGGLDQSPTTPAVSADGGDPDDDSLISVDAVAKRLNVSQRQVYRLIADGKLPVPLRVGKLARWRRADISKWIADGCPASGGAK